MADIAAGDLTYTLQAGTESREASSRYSALYKVVLGDGVDTYPSGGVPLTKAKLGCPNVLLECHIMDASDADGLVYKYDNENQKVRIYQSNLSDTLDGPLVEYSGGSTVVAATTLYVKVTGW